MELLTASKQGDILTVKKLLERKVIHVDYEDEYGDTSLMCASIYGHEKIVELLLKHGADVHHCNIDGSNSVICAMYNSHGKVLKILLDHGAELNSKLDIDEQQIIKDWACTDKYENMDIFETLNKKFS